MSGKRVIVDSDYDQDFLSVELDENAFISRRQEHVLLRIYPRWNPDTLTCDLCIEDQAIPLWNVVGRILEPFFFGDLG